MKICAIDGCGRKVQARGWCNTHYWRWHQYGDAQYCGPINFASRVRAEANGKRYFTGFPCKRSGHIAMRTAGGMCVECYRFRSKEKYDANSEKALAASARWGAANKQRHLDSNREWSKRNRDRKNEHRAKRRAAERRAMPAWADRSEILRIYKAASERGMVVDHFYPLQGKSVSGLHVPGNLQLLSDVENKKKHNKIIDSAGAPV